MREDPIDDFLRRQFGLVGKVALVTGSTRGIGKAIAAALRSAGADVYIHGRSLDEARKVAEELGGRAVAADLRDPIGVESLSAWVVEQGQLDILVNNAGVELGAGIDQLTGDLLDEVFRVNLFAPVSLIRMLLPLMRRSASASILNVSSIHETVPSFSNAAYASSKAALSMVTKTLAVELGPEAIRVNGIAPGAIATDINRRILEEIGERNFREWIPLGRVGEVSDIGAAAVFLASSASSYMTGSTLVIDGGYSHHLVRYRQAHD